MEIDPQYITKLIDVRKLMDATKEEIELLKQFNYASLIPVSSPPGKDSLGITSPQVVPIQLIYTPPPPPPPKSAHNLLLLFFSWLVGWLID